MIKFITVWILTVSYSTDDVKSASASTYQLQYATQAICERQRANHSGYNIVTRCDFAQVPVYTPSK